MIPTSRSLSLSAHDIAGDIIQIMENYSKNQKSVSSKLLDILRKDLNSCFKDSECTKIIFTNNTDKMFFGMCVVPTISDFCDVTEILTGDEPFRIKEYMIEFDSKLFDPALNLTPNEILACLLHEIGHLVNTSAPVDELRKELDVYMMKNNDSLSLDNTRKSNCLLVFGIRDAIRKITSMFENPNKEEIIADKFVIDAGYGDQLLSALKKIQSKAFALNKDVPNKLTVMTWVLRLYKNIGERRIAAIHTLNKAKKVAGSTFVKNDIENTITNLNKFDSISEAESANYKQDARAKYRFKYDIMKKYEENYYEFALRLKSANLEDDALRLLREINSRISVLEEFLEGSELADFDRKRFTNLYDKYIDLREALSKKNVVKDRYIGLWVEYPELN